MEIWNCDSIFEIYPFSIYQSASSQQLLVQANMENCKLEYLGKTEFEYLLGFFDNKIEILGLSRIWSKETNALNNYCGFATEASQTRRNLGLLQFICIVRNSRVQQTLWVLICTRNWITPHFLATNLSMTFLSATKSW